jgi:hypothetical protein
MNLNIYWNNVFLNGTLCVRMALWKLGGGGGGGGKKKKRKFLVLGFGGENLKYLLHLNRHVMAIHKDLSSTSLICLAY